MVPWTHLRYILATMYYMLALWRFDVVISAHSPETIEETKTERVREVLQGSKIQLQEELTVGRNRPAMPSQCHRNQAGPLSRCSVLVSGAEVQADRDVPHTHPHPTR